MNFRRAAFLAMVGCCAIARAGAASVPLNASADQASANSTAINTAIAGAGDYGVVSLPAGTFPIARTLNLSQSLHLRGAGQSKTILRAAFSTAQPMIAGSGVSHVEIDGLTLDGGNSGNVSQGIELQQSASIDIHDLTIQELGGNGGGGAGGDPGPHGIFCTSKVTASIFKSITCRDIGVQSTWGGGIRLSWGSSGNQVLDCVVANTGRGGIFCNDGATDNIIVGNTISGSGGVGLGIEAQNCDRTLIARNRLDHWLSVDNSSLSAVRSNTVCAIDGTYKLCGIEVVDSHDVVVTGNAVTGGEKVGLSISGPNPKTRMYFANNLFEGANTWGTQIEGDAGGVSDLFFESNRFIGTRTGPSPLYANQGHGVRINGNASDIVFDGNEIAHNAGDGIQITGGDVSQLVFSGNSVLDNRGATVDADSTPHVTWRNNHEVPPNAAWDRASENVMIPTATMQIASTATIGKSVSATVSAAAVDAAATGSQSWLWDFGDGLPATGSSVSHVYRHSGTYNVTVVGWDSNGAASRATATVMVTG